jgi:2-keto-4-pentenoate hydratase/2-oxohepta-3-ene-1,7-dioic acid hydratase in catechol pathway
MNYIILKNNERIYPSKVVCIGRNYTEHIKELNNETPEEMVFFFKPNSSVSRVLTFPQGNSSCHYEAEISFLMEENKITAVGFGLDLTLREVQSSLKEKGLPWERAKCFNGSAVFSQFVSFNGEIKQKGDVSLMINKPKEIIDEVLTFSSFEDGDILMTGTPKGVGNFVEGDIFEGKIFEKGKLLVEQRFLVN